MRILFLHRSTLDNISGGVAEFLYYFPLALQKHNVSSYLYSEKRNAQLSESLLLPNGMRSYTGHFIKPSFYTSRKSLKAIIDLCKREKIDLIHAQGVYRTGFLAMQVFKKIGIPYVVTSHADILGTNSERMRRYVVRERCKFVLKHAKAVTHLTPFMATVSHQLYDTTAKSTIIGNGINYLDWLSYINLPEKNYLLAIGRLEKGKGFDVLIDVYAQLLKQGVTSSLVIAGAGSLEKGLKDKARILNIPIVENCQSNDNLPERSIVFTGYIKDDVKKRFITQSKLVLFATQPSEWEEAFGIVLLEAMAAKKSLVASDIAATRYLQTLGMHSKLVPANDISAWSSAIQFLLANDELRIAMADKNHQAVSLFGWDYVAKQYYLDVYKQIGERM